MPPRALVTGACGQDGTYLCRYLLSLGYEVYGLVRRCSRHPITPVPHVSYVEADVCTVATVPNVHEIYHLAAQSHVGYSFDNPAETLQTNIDGTRNMLNHAVAMGAKFYNAATSEMFGATEPPQDETSAFHPRSPYGVSKVAAYWLARNYAERGLWVNNGILFNHESPLRGHDFVTQKICTAAARIARGEQKELYLGNLDARRDWGHADDYVRAMHLMMQAEPGDFVVATGTMHTVREVAETAFSHVGLNWRDYVVTDEGLKRPTEVNALCGNASKIRALSWRQEYTFAAMIEEMVDSA